MVKYYIQFRMMIYVKYLEHLQEKLQVFFISPYPLPPWGYIFYRFLITGIRSLENQFSL